MDSPFSSLFDAIVLRQSVTSFPMFLLATAVFLAVGGWALWQWWRRRGRSEEMFGFAHSNGLTYMPGPSYLTDTWRYGPFKTNESEARHIVTGVWDGASIRVFDWQALKPADARSNGSLLGGTTGIAEMLLSADTGLSENRRMTKVGPVYTVFEITLPYGLWLPEVLVQPENMLTNAAGVLTTDGDVESIEFNRKYRVSGDREAVSKTLHPRMIEYLLSVPASSWHFGASTVTMWAKGPVPALDLSERVRALVNAAVLLPEWLGREDGTPLPSDDWRTGKTVNTRPPEARSNREIGFTPEDDWSTFGDTPTP